VLPALEREHDVLAPTLAGHAGGPPLDDVRGDALADGVEAAMDEAGFESAHIVGNSLGGYVALQLAERGRADSVVAFAPAGGWEEGNPHLSLDYFPQMQELVKNALPHVDALLSSPEGRRRATAFITTNYEHIPAELLAHQLHGVAGCEGLLAMVSYAAESGWSLDAEKITCPVRIVWGTDDKLLPWPSAAVRYQREWVPGADWVVMDGIGHCPQLDVPLEAAELILGFTRP
jgi:pimeloyl-ACP methyl ester carboxylesterase